MHRIVAMSGVSGGSQKRTKRKPNRKQRVLVPGPEVDRGAGRHFLFLFVGNLAGVGSMAVP